MVALLCFLLMLLASPFKSKNRLEAENAVLRHQLILLQRKVRGRVQFTNSDRLFFIQLYRWFPSVLKAMTIIRPETLVRPQIAADLRVLIRRMSVENLLSGAPRIHGELLKLGFSVAQSTVHPVRAGEPFCATMRHTSRPWTCSWFRPSALSCFMFWSSSDWPGENWRGST